MTEIQAEVDSLGEEPISVRGYINRDDELMVIFKLTFTVTTWNVKIFYEALADEMPILIHCKNTSKGYFFA